MDVTDSKISEPAHRLRRIVLTSILVAILVAALAAFLMYRASGKVPEWYRPPDTQASSTTHDAREAENKIADVQSWAASKHAYDYASQYGRPLAKRPADQLVISFTQGEVNSYLSKWYAMFGGQTIDGRRLNDVFKGPMVRIEKERITFAGTVPPLGGRVVSLDLKPVVRDGKLDLQLLTARSGNLALPEFTWAKPRQMLIESLSGMKGKFVPIAKLDKIGGANMEAVSSVMAMQGVDALSHRATENVLFLPVWSEKAGLPVKLMSCELQDGQITLTTEPLTPAEREALVYKLRGGKQPESTPVYLTPSTRSTP